MESRQMQDTVTQAELEKHVGYSLFQGHGHHHENVSHCPEYRDKGGAFRYLAEAWLDHQFPRDQLDKQTHEQ